MIHIEHLGKDYGTKTALYDLCLDVPPGQLFCFLGPNGAGKTTTLKILTGLLRPSRGRALIHGFDVRTQAQEAKAITGYIPDMPFLYDRLTTVEFCEFTADLFHIPLSEARLSINRWFECFSLDTYRSTLVKDLSHGLRQRLIYCATLLHNPRVLFIDEPLIGLDPYTIRLIKNLLRESCRNGMTVFLTTHILALAEDIADQIGIIDDGRLIALGTLAELKRDHGGMNLEDCFLGLTSNPQE
ncbi:MAG: hypothetical protein A2269_02785 [Lentisphaerae bacterium RIFOXYA12_FULL_60_10]|nr:MAG: hypothetical protein A2269_02785 [Lentisphaerae bacterium RIFOXYA12_FULL_60_10]